MENIEKFKWADTKKCKAVLAAHPEYKVFKRTGFAFRGAEEYEVHREGLRMLLYPGGRSKMGTFDEQMQRFFDWACVVDIEIDHGKKEIHFNGYSENDMW